MNEQALQATFLDLHHRLSAQGLEILLGGGFGLFLKQLDLISRPEVRTLLPREAWPRPRSTADLDVFFPLEVLTSLSDMQAVRATIDQMKFEPIDGSKYWQFALPSSQVTIDLLTGPIEESAKSKLKSDSRRARPKGDVQLHAHPVPEALDLSEDLETISLSGQLAGGRKHTAAIKIPSPFTYLMMKITAFGDQLDNPDKNQGRHHALDVYRIVSMITEAQFDQTKWHFAKNADSAYTKRVRELSSEFFSTSRSVGILRMREHEFFGENMQLESFMGSLQEMVRS